MRREAVQRKVGVALSVGLLFSIPVGADELRVQPARIHATSGEQGASVVVPLDNTGIADWAFLNPRRPVYVFSPFKAAADKEAAKAPSPAPPGAPAPAAPTPGPELIALDKVVRGMPLSPGEGLNLGSLLGIPGRIPAPLSLEFVNRTAERVITVSMKIPVTDPDTLDATIKAGHPEICRKLPSDAKKCEFFLTIAPGSSGLIDLVDVVRIVSGGKGIPVGEGMPGEPTKAPLKFTVSFFREDQEPANPVGFIALVEKPEEKADDTPEITAVAVIRGSRDPFLGTDDTNKIGSANPYRGAMRSHYPAEGRLSFARLLGQRARADVDLRYKRGDLGGEDTGNSLSAPKYRIDVYSVSGVVLSFGRFDMATPSEGLAVKASGEGFRLAFRNGGLTYLINRESDARVADQLNHDSSAWMLQLNNLSMPAWSAIHSLSLIGLYGREGHTDKPTDGKPPAIMAHQYGTAGIEIAFGVAAAGLRGTAAAYHSRRYEWRSSGIAPGRGTSALISLTRSFVAQAEGSSKKVVARSLTVTAGYGTGDKVDTPRDEGYLGETAGYAPDKLFLSTLVPRVVPATGTIGSGLSNKTYFSAGLVDQTFSPLAWIAELLGARNDIESRSTALRWHVFRLNEPIGGSHSAGQELSAEFQVETPKGVRVTVTAARFFTSSALEGLFVREPWLFVAGISLKL